MPWFRVYVEMVTDVKLLELPPGQRWVWIAVLAIARQSPISGYLMVSIRRPMTEKTIANLMHVPLRDVKRALESFEANDMIHRDDDIGAWCVSNWSTRQFESDDVTERSRKHRTLQRSNAVASNVADPFDATCSESESDTETESSSSSSDSRGSSQPVDNPTDGVPAETWDAYAEIKLRRQNETSDRVKNPVPWKRTIVVNAKAELGDLAAMWWTEYDITPRRLAECLMDGRIRDVQRRVTT